VVPATTNHGVREVRSVVLIRKIMYGNRSGEGRVDPRFFYEYIPHLETARQKSHRELCGRSAEIHPRRAFVSFPSS